jgi:hypothetical protein
MTWDAVGCPGRGRCKIGDRGTRKTSFHHGGTENSPRKLKCKAIEAGKKLLASAFSQQRPKPSENQKPTRIGADDTETKDRDIGKPVFSTKAISLEINVAASSRGKTKKSAAA